MTKAGKQQTTQPDNPYPGAGTTPTLWGRVSQAASETIQTFVRRPASQTPAQQAPARQTPAQQAQPGQKSPVSFKQMIIGLAAYMIGSTALQLIMGVVDNNFNLHLQTTTQTLFPTSWPLVGNMSKFALIYLLLLLAYVWLLFRLNIIPRDLFRPRNATARNAATPTMTVSPGRSKSARKRAGLTTTSTSSVAKAHTATRRSGVAARAARAEANGNASVSSDDADDEYDRVRSLMRRRRKR